jgi:hypothetical protein
MPQWPTQKLSSSSSRSESQRLRSRASSRCVRGQVGGGVGVADDGAVEVGEVVAFVVVLEGGDLVFGEAGLLGDADVVRELVLAAADLGDAEDRDLAQAR